MSTRHPKAAYVQVIPIYLSSDLGATKYFSDYADEIDAITGSDIVVAVPREVQAGDSQGVSVVFHDPDSAARYRGLKLSDLPCLWVEDGGGGHAIVGLPTDFGEISQTLRVLTDCAKTTKDAQQIVSLVSTRLPQYTFRRSPSLRALISGGFDVSKSTERLISLGFGVLFIVVVLVIALVKPNPSAFQYTVFRIVLSLAAGGFVSMTPGFIEVKIANWLRAGGALAVFVIVFFYAPAALNAVGK